MKLLTCPVCGAALAAEGRTLRCGGGHCFDCAKEGYVNLLISGRPGDSRGDNKDMARSRRDFLNQGYYQSLAKAVGDCVENFCPDGGTVFDICCGEGYYTDFLSKNYNCRFYGFDISKNMVRLAAKRKCGAVFFVANIAAIPVKTGAVDMAFHLFAPFHADEFSRVLADDGVPEGDDAGYDLFLGNPPYYGDWCIAETFIATARRALRKGGVCMTVAKSDGGLHEIQAKVFGDAAVTRRRGYCVFSSIHP